LNGSGVEEKKTKKRSGLQDWVFGRMEVPQIEMETVREGGLGRQMA